MSKNNILDTIQSKIMYIEQLPDKSWIRCTRLFDLLEFGYENRKNIRGNEEIIVSLLNTLENNKNLFTENFYHTSYNKFHTLRQVQDSKILPFVEEIERLSEELEKLKEDVEYYKKDNERLRREKNLR